MTTDIRFTQAANGIWDISLDSNGDITNGDFLDTSLLYALLGERRATEYEVPISSTRRGWIGNENKTFKNVSARTDSPDTPFMKLRKLEFAIFLAAQSLPPGM